MFVFSTSSPSRWAEVYLVRTHLLQLHLAPAGKHTIIVVIVVIVIIIVVFLLTVIIVDVDTATVPISLSGLVHL